MVQTLHEAPLVLTLPPASALIAMPPFTCVDAWGDVCDSTRCAHCAEIVCADDDHWINDVAWCFHYGAEIVHRECHDRVCQSASCQAEYDA